MMARTQPLTSLRLGLVQMTSTNTHAGNVDVLRECAAEAAAADCRMIAFPEVAGLMNRHIDDMRDQITDEARDPFINAAREEAARLGLWIHTGSTPVVRSGETRFFNHSNLIDATGRIVASYDKIHLFDHYPEDGPPILESRRYAPGAHSVLAETPWGRIGMSICYDLRFPALYRSYAQEGAAMFFVPSAFTVHTGRAHWETLLKARAIENGNYVVAAAQTGSHDDGRKTWGHSMVVAPTGAVLADMGTRTGLKVIDMDLGAVPAARAAIPSLNHDRAYTALKSRPLE